MKKIIVKGIIMVALAALLFIAGALTAIDALKQGVQFSTPEIVVNWHGHSYQMVTGQEISIPAGQLASNQ